MPELPEVRDLRERIENAVADYVVGRGSVEACTDAVLDVLNPQQVGWALVGVDGAFAGFDYDWDEGSVPVFTLSTEPEDAGLTVEAAEPCAPASPVGTPPSLCGWVPGGHDPGWCSRGHGHDGPHFLHPTREGAVAAAGLTGDCSVDCLSGCAYPGEFSECAAASTKENEDG